MGICVHIYIYTPNGNIIGIQWEHLWEYLREYNENILYTTRYI